jgi:protease I
MLLGGKKKMNTNKKVVLVIASDNFRDEELTNTQNELEKKGIKTTIASSKLTESHGVKGLRNVKPELLLSKVDINNYDGIAFIGGIGAQEYWNDPTAHKLAKDAYAKGKIVGAICIAPVILANAGLLAGKHFNVWSSEIETVKAKGGLHSSQPVVVDGKIVTGNGPDAATEFGQKMAEKVLSN